jgi:hypothetical protein
MKMKTLAIFAAAAALAVSARGEQITAEPDAFLDYIEATGSQYIDTGVNAETGLKAYVDFAWATYSGNPDWSLLDACIDSSVSDKRNRFLMCHMFNGKPYFGYGVKQQPLLWQGIRLRGLCHGSRCKQQRKSGSSRGR